MRLLEQQVEKRAAFVGMQPFDAQGELGLT